MCFRARLDGGWSSGSEGISEGVARASLHSRRPGNFGLGCTSEILSSMSTSTLLMSQPMAICSLLELPEWWDTKLRGCFGMVYPDEMLVTWPPDELCFLPSWVPVVPLDSPIWSPLPFRSCKEPYVGPT